MDHYATQATLVNTDHTENTLNDFDGLRFVKKQQKSGIRYTRCMCEVSCHCKRYVIRCAIEITLSVCLCLLIN